MSRAIVMLAIDTGIPPSVWWAEDERDLATALDVMDKERERQERESGRPPRDGGGAVTSG